MTASRADGARHRITRGTARPLGATFAILLLFTQACHRSQPKAPPPPAPEVRLLVPGHRGVVRGEQLLLIGSPRPVGGPYHVIIYDITSGTGRIAHEADIIMDACWIPNTRFLLVSEGKAVKCLTVDERGQVSERHRLNLGLDRQYVIAQLSPNSEGRWVAAIVRDSGGSFQYAVAVIDMERESATMTQLRTRDYWAPAWVNESSFVVGSDDGVVQVKMGKGGPSVQEANGGWERGDVVLGALGAKAVVGRGNGVWCAGVLVCRTPGEFALHGQTALGRDLIVAMTRTGQVSAFDEMGRELASGRVDDDVSLGGSDADNVIYGVMSKRPVEVKMNGSGEGGITVRRMELRSQR